MSRREFKTWIEFYKRWPFDDLHRFHRPAALGAHASSGADLTKLIEFLQPTAHDDSPDAFKAGWEAFLYDPPET